MSSAHREILSVNQRNHALIGRLRRAMYNYDPALLPGTLTDLFAKDCVINLAYPFETLIGPEAFNADVLLPLTRAIPDLERRDYIVIAGGADGADWVGCAGFYTGVFEKPWLDIPSTGQQVSMRFHEFYRIEENEIVEVQGLWDIPEVMHQANAWPLAPSLSRDWLVPGPATQDGIRSDITTALPNQETQTSASLELVRNMLRALGQFASGGAEVMELDRYWHPKMNWYGPSGIGTSRRISGFRYWHQIPFLHAMPDRQGGIDGGTLFGEDHYVGFTAWPGMTATISGDGWMGIAPGNQKISMRSLDFWRCEGGLIRENWVLVDLLSIYQQIGVDVFARLRELTAHRQAHRPDLWTTGRSNDHSGFKS